METTSKYSQGQKITIRNKEYLISELQENATRKVIGLLLEYIKDPNCSADLWIKDSELNQMEQASFIFACNNHNELLNNN